MISTSAAALFCLASALFGVSVTTNAAEQVMKTRTAYPYWTAFCSGVCIVLGIVAAFL